MTQVAADNDILYKGAWFGLAAELLAAIVPDTAAEVVILGQARFVVGKRLQKQQRKGLSGAAEAAERFNAIVATLSSAEPSPDEQSLAAELENAAQHEGVDLDPGESLLCAMAIHRAFERFATGDKRAITAVEVLSHREVVLAKLAGRIVCLEQLFVRLLQRDDLARVRGAVCAANHVDKALASCFSCTSKETRLSDCMAGLESYIRALRNQASTMLDA